MTTLVMLSVLVFGIMAYLRLPVSDLPNVDYPHHPVTGQLPGANPTTMATAVATPLEREFSTISGLESMTSSSSMGTTQIILQFTLNRDIDAAAQDVQVAISRVLRQLPKDMPTPPTFRKVNPADQPILRIALTSPTLPLYTLNEYGDTLMAQRISMVSGVAQVQVYGAQKFAVRVQVDPQELAARGIGIDQVAEAVAKANVNLPTGTLYGAQQALTVQASGQLTHGRALQLGDRHLPRGAARAGRGHRDGLQQRRKRQDGGLVRQPALDHPGRPAPAGHQHRRGGQGRQEPAAPHAGAAARLRVHARPLRRIDLDRGIRPGRASSRCCSPWCWWSW